MLEAVLLARLRQAAGNVFRDRPVLDPNAPVGTLRTPVLAAYAFGSRISGTPRPDSDLDVGYYLESHHRGEGFPIAEEMRVASVFSDAVGLNVDLRNLGCAPLELRGRVLEEGVRIYSGDPARRVALERDLLSRYHDYKEVFQQMHVVRLRAVAERGL